MIRIFRTSAFVARTGSTLVIVISFRSWLLWWISINPRSNMYIQIPYQHTVLMLLEVCVSQIIQNWIRSTLQFYYGKTTASHIRLGLVAASKLKSLKISRGSDRTVGGLIILSRRLVCLLSSWVESCHSQLYCNWSSLPE